MLYTSLSSEAAAAKIEKLFADRGPLTHSEFVFYGGMTDAAVGRGLDYLTARDMEHSCKDIKHNEILTNRYLNPANSDIPSNLKVGLSPFIDDINSYQQALRFLQERFLEISEPDSCFNQNFVTPDTSVRRILYAATRDNLKNKSLYFLGDDDLTSIVAAKLYPDSEIFVLDIDPQLLSSISECAKTHRLRNLKVIQHDAFEELPINLLSSADFVWCDPSKRVLDVFLKNASSLIHDNGVIYTFAQPEYLPVSKDFFETMLKYNMIATDIIPRFNQYCGSGQYSRANASLNKFQLAFTESLVRLIKLQS